MQHPTTVLLVSLLSSTPAAADAVIAVRDDADKIVVYKVHAGGLTKIVSDQKKTKTKGAVCQGPSASKTWPDNTVDIPFAMKPSKVTWLRADPAGSADLRQGHEPDRPDRVSRGGVLRLQDPLR